MLKSYQEEACEIVRQIWKNSSFEGFSRDDIMLFNSNYGYANRSRKDELAYAYSDEDTVKELIKLGVIKVRGNTCEVDTEIRTNRVYRDDHTVLHFDLNIDLIEEIQGDLKVLYSKSENQIVETKSIIVSYKALSLAEDGTLYEKNKPLTSFRTNKGHNGEFEFIRRLLQLQKLGKDKIVPTTEIEKKVLQNTTKSVSMINLYESINKKLQESSLRIKKSGDGFLIEFKTGK